MPQEKLIILGAGESGQGAALLGKSKGYNVFGNLLEQRHQRLCDL